MLITRANIVCKEPLAQKCWNIHESSIKFAPASVSFIFPYNMLQPRMDALVEGKRWVTPIEWMQHGGPTDRQKRTASFSKVTEALFTYDAFREHIAGDIEFKPLELAFGIWARRKLGILDWLERDEEFHPVTSTIQIWRTGRAIKYHFNSDFNSKPVKERKSRSSTQIKKRRGRSRHHSQTKTSEDDGYSSAASRTSS